MIWPDLTSRSRKVPSAGAERIGAIVWPQSGHRPPLSSLNRRSWGSTDSQCQAKHCQVSAARSVGWLYSADESGLFHQPEQESRRDLLLGAHIGMFVRFVCRSCHVSPPRLHLTRFAGQIWPEIATVEP